jgi:hypothetical protein
MELPYNHEGMLAFPSSRPLDGYHRSTSPRRSRPAQALVNAQDWVIHGSDRSITIVIRPAASASA